MAGPSTPDAITVSGYFGEDGLRPFVEIGAETGKGVFVLVRTSNPSAADIQDFTRADGTKFYEHMARQVAALGSAPELIGQSGYSCVGAVVAATYPDEARRLREIMPQQLFLVPGYGAQGATAADCAAAFKDDGTGAIVNASRSVIYAYQNEQYKNMKWQGAVKKAAKAFADDIRNAVGP
jgi:orotidine-5'-phosphate decarboxylase